MRIHIAYFTSTGNTLWLAEKAKELMEKEGHNVELFEIIKDGEAFAEKECDLKGFFYPVWGSNPPDPMVEFREKMPEGDGQKIFLIANCCALYGDTGFFWKKMLDAKGYDVFYTSHMYMPTNFNLPFEPENYWKRVPLEAERDAIIAKAEQKLEVICSEILKGERKADGTKILEEFAGAMQRETYWVGNGYKHHFSVDMDRCTNCKLCYRMCPSENITITESGEHIFGDKCMLCVKCYNLCPTNAVLICEKSVDDKKYRRYKGPSKHVRPVEYR